MEEYSKSSNKSRIWRMLAIVVVVGLFLVLIIINVTSRPSLSDQVWDQRTTVGNLEAKNYYIMYTDLMCPYCDVFSREMMNHWDEFEQYIADNDILYEIRLTDYLYEGNNIQSSRDSAEAVYCATREDRFWDYYHEALQTLWDDYHSKGIGVSKTAPRIQNIPDDYWLKIGHSIGLGQTFDDCVANHEALDELGKNTARALQASQGMPSFKFNKFTTSGFDNNWDWTYVKQYLDAGLNAK